MATDSPEGGTGFADRPRDIDAPGPKTGDGLLARLAGLPDWHPSSSRYQLERPRTDARSELGEGRPPVGDADDKAGSGSGDGTAPYDIRMSAERRTHILEGDETGGGHRHGVGRPGKTEFPADWDDAKIMDHVLSVARAPDELPVQQRWNERWRVRGEREGVSIAAVLTADGRVWAAWPTDGSPGVVKNKLEDI